MTIQEILEAHKVSAFAGSDTACSCDRTWRTNSEYRKHLTEVLEQHMKEREAEAWNEGYGDCWDYHTSQGMAGRQDNPYRKESSDGR